MFFYLKISCKDKRILKKFLRFFTKINPFLPISLKFFSRQKKRKFVTILKSPHVNKTAQSQFEFRLYSKSFLVYSFRPFIFVLFLKKLRSLSFPGLKIEVKNLLEINRTHGRVLSILNPDNIILRNIRFGDFQKKKWKKIRYKKNFNPELSFSKRYLQLFDLYGETSLKKKVFDSFIYLTLSIFSSVG